MLFAKEIGAVIDVGGGLCDLRMTRTVDRVLKERAKCSFRDGLASQCPMHFAKCMSVEAVHNEQGCTGETDRILCHNKRRSGV